MAHDFYRPPCVARCEAGLDAQGRVVAWRHASAGPAIVPQVLSRTFGLAGAGPDKTTAEGAFDQAYEWPAARIAHEAVELPLQVGFWRSVGHSHQAFFKESFVDEAAVAAGADPVAFRANLLAQHPRHKAVLLRAAELAGWGKPLAPAPDGAKRARGVALHQSFGSIVAQVAEVSVTADQRIRVHRIVCVVDCGVAVNPDGIRQQIDSAVVYGLSAALYGEITLVGGRVQQTNFHDQAALRITECPLIETEIVASAEPPEGIGEPGLPPVAPAVANALFALTGRRLRSLPLKLA
jgi:isoquinoline 1-oxidoreductase beta subunit